MCINIMLIDNINIIIVLINSIVININYIFICMSEPRARPSCLIAVVVAVAAAAAHWIAVRGYRLGTRF